MRKNRQISWILTLVFMFSIIFSLPAVPVVAGCQDISGHWAESQIESLMSQNIINGYPDNTFRSENPISRAEFIVITNKAFNFSDSTAINYSDVKPTDWFAADIARAKAAGYISGYEDGTMKPNQQISRQEAASIVARILSLQPVDTTATLQRFSDGKTIANWSRDSIAAMIENGYLKGYPDNTFKPTNSIKRAEAAVLFKIVLDSERDAFKPEPKPEVQSLFDQAGTYGPETGTLVINKDVTISASGVTLQNLIIEKDLIIAKEVGDGDVTLNNVTVKGKTYVRGGGKDSIHINGGQYSEIIIEKTATGEVRIVAVDTTGLRVTISENAKGEEIILNGDFKSVTVNADDVNLTTQSETSIGELKVESGLKDVNIELAKDSTVKEIVLNSKTDVEGKGTIEKASGSKAKESSYATQPGSITTPSTSSGSGGGGGGGGGGDSTVAVSAISVEPTTMTLTVGATGEITATVEPSNASNKKANWTTSDANVATVDANGKVTAKAVGTATITATTEDGGKTATCTVTVEAASEEPEVETIAANVDYKAVWNEARGTWYIKVTVPNEDLDSNSVQAIKVIKEAGVALDEPRDLTPDSDKVMWFGVAKGDGDLTLKANGEYAYEVVRTDGSKYIFNFTYDPSQVQGVTNLVAAALDAVNNATSADNYAAVRTALEENANKLGLNLDVYNQLTPDGRKNAVANDIYNNKPAGGYTIETLKPMFDEIVATRMVFQNSVALFAAASADNPLEDLSYITMLITNLEGVQKQTKHSGRSIKDDILPELNKLVEDFEALNEAQQEAVLASIDYTKSSSSTATRNALRAAITKVLEDEAAAVQAALDAVNAAQITDRVEAYNKLMEVAETLGLNVGEGSDFAGLVQGRAEAAAKDLFDNKPAGGYDLETLQATFNEIVATRLVFEQSVALFAAASAENPLEDLSYITMLIDNLDAVEYQTIHSGKTIESILQELNKLVEDFEALNEAQQEAVLASIDYTKSSSSTATRNALRAALNAQAAINARLAITSVSIADNTAYASTAADGGTVRVLGYGVGINLDANNSGKKISDTTSIVIELYEGEKLLGQQIFNEAGYEKHGDKSSTSGTIDAGGQYVATSWDNSWSAAISDIPTKAVATVQYTDGIATAEMALNFTDDQTKIFLAAEAVYALFMNPLADVEDLTLKEGVNKETIEAAQTKVNAVGEGSSHKTLFVEMIAKANSLLNPDQGGGTSDETGSGNNGEDTTSSED